VTDDALLSVAGRELVAEFRDALVAHAHLRELRAVLALHQRHRVHDAVLARAHRHGRLAALLRAEPAHVLGFLEEPRRTRLPEQDRGFVDLRLGVDEAVLVEVAVGVLAASPAHVVAGNLEAVLLAAGVAPLLALVGAEEVRAGERALHGALVHDERVLDVEPLVGHHGDDEVLARGPVVVADLLGGLGVHHRLLRIVQEVLAGVRPDAVVRRRQAQTLLHHPRPIVMRGWRCARGTGSSRRRCRR